MSNSGAFDLFLSDEVQALIDDFAALLDIRVTFFSADGVWMRRGKSMRNCEFCQLVQNELGELDKCLVMDGDKQAEAVARRGIVCYRCHAGLHEGIAPIFVHNKLAGYLMIGQFRVGDALPVKLFERVPSPTLRRRLEAAFEVLPKFAPEKFSSIVGLFKTLIDYIAVRELAVLQSDRLRLDIDRYIKTHGAEDIRLPDMARKLGRSVSTISQFLRREYDTSFKELLIEHRLRRAEQFWREYPEATVAEAAFASGFTDQFYFSRVFRRRRGLPPREYRDRQRRRLDSGGVHSGDSHDGAD